MRVMARGVVFGAGHVGSIPRRASSRSKPPMPACLGSFEDRPDRSASYGNSSTA